MTLNFVTMIKTSTSTSSSATYPNLKLNPFVLSEDRLYFEINAYCGDEGRCEGIIGITEKEACLAHGTVANDQQLEHVIEVLIGSIFLPGSSLCRHLKKRGKVKIMNHTSEKKLREIKTMIA